MTNDEREHLKKLKEWHEAAKAAHAELKKSPHWALLEKVMKGNSADVLLANIDWLISTLERDDKTLRHRQGVRALRALTEQK